MKNTLFPLLLIFALMLFSISRNDNLVGSLTEETILESYPDWLEVKASYFPDPESLARLKSVQVPVHIEVVLGTWCPDSKQHVSAYFKLIELAENPMIQSLYTGIPKEKEAREPYIRGKNITRVPTFIVTIDGEEHGRIIEHPEKSIEEDLVSIIFSDLLLLDRSDDFSGDDQALNLVGSFIDLEKLSIPEQFFHRIVFHVAVPS